MRRSSLLLAVLCLLVLLLTLIAPLAPVALAQTADEEPPPAEEGDAVLGQMIIRFKPGVTPQQVSDFYAQYGLAERANLDYNTTDRDAGQRLVAVPTEVKASFIELLAADPRLVYAEPNYLIYVDKAANDPDYSKLWGLNNTGQTGGTNNADINAPEAWDVSTGSTDVIVGVIDTGIDYTHEDLAKNMWVNPGECPGGTCNANGKDDDNNGYVDDFYGINTIDDSGDIMDDFGHGTHVAGTIGAVGDNGLGIVGVNWKVRMIGCKFLSASGSGTVAGAVKCFNYFRDLRNKYKQNVVLTSNSWGASVFSQALYDAMAGPDQPLHICAAGNSDTDRPHYPSGFDLDHIISVAATDHNDNYASFSNYGTPHVDLAAPGVDIYSTVPKGDCPICDPSGYTSISGTSMATPHVSGVAALLWAQYPKLTREQIKGRVMSAVDPLKDRSKLTLTNGRLNVLNALENDAIPPATVTNLTVSGVLMTRVKLTWTATGDDGMNGLANSYEVRYSTTPISDANWDRATPATGVPSPQKPGTTESFAVTGLEPGKTYYFALKVLDNAGNSSELSNVVVGKTSAGTIVFADDMESGPAKWTTAGKDSLWHLSALRSNSPINAWYYGKEDKRNYDTGGINNGTLTSQAINLVGADDTLLTFYEWSQVQTSERLDRTRVQLSTDGQAWTTIFESHGTQDAWVKRTVDLTPYISATTTVHLRFWFDTVDNSSNQFEGWYVDDVQVLTAKEELPGGQQPTANLTIPEGNLLFDPLNPAANSSVKLHATVINNGSAEANDVLVQFMDTTSGTGIPIGQPQLITNIPVGGSGTAQVMYETGGNVGNRGIQVMADPNNYIPELNEADNSTLRILTIAAAAAPNLQVRSANIGFEPPTLNPGDQVTIRATVFNTGTVEARDVVVQFADVTSTGSTTIGESQTIDVIAPGGSAAVEITYDTAGLTGDRDIEVRVDPNNAILESNESDNKVEKTIKLTPKLAPNLNIQATNIGFTPPTPTAGQVITLYATVLNDGNAAVSGAVVQFMDVTNTATTVPIGEPQTIENLPVGGSATVQVAYDTANKVGDRKIEVNVDPNNFINELRESDNKAQKTIKVTATTAPNLVINSANINFSPALPVEGAPVTILATVLNNGAVDATDVVVQFLDANNGAGLPIGETQTIAFIPAGGSAVAQVTFDSTDKAGDRSIQVVVDPNNTIQETDETDNTARDGLRVVQSALPNLVLLANNIEFYPPTPTANDEVTINVVVLNNGVTDAYRVLVQVIDLTTGSAVPIGPEQFIDVVPAGSSASAQVTFNAQSMVKDRKLQVLVDSNNLIEESNESDNTISKLLPIGSSAAPNLVMLAENIGFSPSHPTQGVTVTITAVVVNRGDADAANVVVQFVDYTTGRPLPIGVEQTIATIPVGGSGVAQVTMQTLNQPGDHQIRVSVDPGNVIAESDETDNKNSAILTVAQPAAANLVIPPSNIGFDPPNPVEGQPVSITVTILNVGAVDASNVLVQFVDVTDGGFVPIGAKQTITTIVAGREALAQVTYDTTGKAGERKIYAVADPHTTIPETNEADNSATQTLVVLPQPMPNLVVAESNIGFSPLLPNAGEQVTIHATILNNGQADAVNVTVQVLDTTNNAATPIAASQTISLIPAGASAVVVLTYDTTDKPGDRKLQVIADRNNLIEESNETDNSAKKTLKVTPPALANLAIQSGNIGFDPAAPEPGAQVTIFATVINDGNTAASNVAVQFFDATNTGSLLPIGAVQIIPTIPAGGSGSAQVVYDTAGLSGDRKIQVTVDPNNFIPEVKKSDNTVQKSLLLASAATPNLAVAASSIGFAATNPTAGETLTLLVTVLNDGGATAHDVVVQFMDATDSTTLPIGQPQTIDLIPVGGSGVAQVQFDTTNRPGARKIQVMVDPNNFISERSETDNSATATLRVNALAAPNLVVQASNIGFGGPLGAANPLEGDEVTVQVAVLNNGGADASDVIVQFVDLTDGTATPIGAPQSITTIPAGSSGVAQLSYATAGKIGARKIQVIADPNNYIPESDENDNRATDTLQVDPPLAANLKLLAGNLKFDPPAPEQGDLVTITLTILNDGNAVASDVVVQLTDISGGGAKPIGVEQTIESIPPGGSAPLHVRYDATDEPGDREIEVIVDPNDLIRESDESDNRVSKRLTVSPPIIPNIVVLPANINFAPLTPIEGDVVTITVSILNQGTGAVSDLLVHIIDNTDGTGEIIGGPQTIPTLAAGGTAEIKVFYQTTGKVGERRIQVIADPENAIAETNERDNEATKSLKVLSQAEKPEPQPNLVIKAESIVMSTTAPAGSPVTVTVTVSNTGDGNARDVVVQLSDVSNGNSEVVGRVMLTGTMVAGRSGRTRLIYDTTGKTGKHEMQVLADPDNTIPESDESDNQASKSITVTAASTTGVSEQTLITISVTTPITTTTTEEPNLVVQTDNIRYFTPQSSDGSAVPQTLTLEVTILNTGAEEARNIGVEFIAMTQQGWSPIGDEQLIETIPARGTGTAQVTYDLSELSGSVEVRVLVDPKNAIAEADEADNRASRLLSIDMVGLEKKP